MDVAFAITQVKVNGPVMGQLRATFDTGPVRARFRSFNISTFQNKKCSNCLPQEEKREEKDYWWARTGLSKRAHYNRFWVRNGPDKITSLSILTRGGRQDGINFMNS